MSEKDQEKQADIIAEMRMGKPIGPCAYMIGLPDKEEVYESGAKRRITMIKKVTVQELADRLEEAAKREKAQHGNAAALREALTNLTRYGESDIRQLEQLAKRAIDNDIYGGGILQSLCAAIREGKEALSAPARNCDRFATVKDAAKAFADERNNAPHPCPDFTFSTWLFAPTTERKGEGDER